MELAVTFGLLAMIILFTTQIGNKILLKASFLFMVIIRNLIIVGLLWAIINSPQFYKKFGWTPMSVIVGDVLYKGHK